MDGTFIKIKEFQLISVAKIFVINHVSFNILSKHHWGYERS